MQLGEHNIEDELVFTKHDSYVFHVSHDNKSGDEDEMGIVQEFVRRKLSERRLEDRLHVIWFVFSGCLPTVANSQSFVFRYCIPMDNHPPVIDLKHFNDIYPNKEGMSKCIFRSWA